MHLFCYAKINLGLSVLAKRPDGYHELETLMHEIDLRDDLLVEPFQGDRDHLEVEGLGLVANSDNLLFKTLRLIRGAGYSMPSVHMRLHKKIPIGGGLGGGSSNAIALLRHGAECCKISWADQDRIAAQLGSDTNFFLRGTTALCKGRGEKIELMPHPKLFFNLIFPSFSCSTPKVFAAFSMDQVQLNASERWKNGEGYGNNDLEAACCKAYPEMGALMQKLRASGQKVFLSGSGSTLFTVHSEAADRDSKAQEIKSLFGEGFCYPAQSLCRGEI